MHGPRSNKQSTPPASPPQIFPPSPPTTPPQPFLPSPPHSPSQKSLEFAVQRPSPPRRARLEELPFELKLMIMEEVPDLTSVKSLSFVSRDFHGIWESKKIMILSNNFLSDLSSELLAEAHNIVRLSRLGYGRDNHRQVVEIFLDDAEYPENLKTSQIEPTRLSDIAALHDDIKWLATDFYRSTLLKHPITGDKLENLPHPSRTELNRIYRGFYILEYFCNCFRVSPQGIARDFFTAEDQANLFLSGYSAYEVEELVCIRDYIFRTLSEMFPDIEEELSQTSIRYVELDPWLHPDTPAPPGVEYYQDPTPMWFAPDCKGGLDFSSGKFICICLVGLHILIWRRLSRYESTKIPQRDSTSKGGFIPSTIIFCTYKERKDTDFLARLGPQAV